MPQTDAGAHPYDVQCSAVVTEAIKQLHNEAASAGHGGQFVSALKAIYDRLQNAPREFGEPLYHLPALELEIRVGIVSPLVVLFGVQEEKHLVFLKGVTFTSRRGF